MFTSVDVTTLSNRTNCSSLSPAIPSSGDLDVRITAAMLDTGLRGVPVGTCTTSFITPEQGLHYRGYPIADLVNHTPEQLMHLVFMGSLGSPSEVDGFSQVLANRAGLSATVKMQISNLPRHIHPMSAFAAAIRFCQWEYPTGDYHKDALNLLAKAPELAATVIRRHKGCEPLSNAEAENRSMGYVERFCELLVGSEACTTQFVEAVKIFHKLHYDHGGGNLSMFVAKAVASGHSDLYGSVIAGMEALAGPLHGRANQEGLTFVQDILEKLGAAATPKQVREEVQRRFDNKEKIVGFGHAVLRCEDPRASILYDYAANHFPENPLVKMALMLRTEAPKVVCKKASNPYANVDAISGTVLAAAGFSHAEYFTILFGLSRLVGMTRQIVYERCEARDGKGVPIYRPKYVYKEG
ncbi:Probable citrate synthase 1, mitochondrial [Chlamydiales bacterium SCGC AG-110-P3]|nr:Probable citrate synthase 1, mitochondrial [Chlamydiales bacterium SCGC AG-110-P3]